MANPNPNEATRFETDREESLTKQMNIRVAPSVYEKIKQKKNWRERVRAAIAEIAEETEPETEKKELKSA